MFKLRLNRLKKIVVLLNMVINNKKRNYLLAAIWTLTIFFGYKLVGSITAPMQFDRVKTERYSKVIKNLKDIANSQVAHKSVQGVYANDFESLVKFIDTANYVILEKRDSSYFEYDRVYRIDMLREIQITDTLGFVSVKDSLFGESDRYKSMMNVPIKGVDAVFSMEADIIDKNGYQVPVFEVSVKKNIVLFEQDKNLLKQENKVVSVDGVNGNSIVLGSLVEVSTSGNWPTLYDAGSNN